MWYIRFAHLLRILVFYDCDAVSLGERFTMTWRHFQDDPNPQNRMSKHVHESWHKALYFPSITGTWNKRQRTQSRNHFDRKTKWKGENWNEITHHKVQWLQFEIMTINLQVLKNRYSISYIITVNFTRQTWTRNNDDYKINKKDLPPHQEVSAKSMIL